MNNFGIAEEHYVWIKKILFAYLPGSDVFAFGSRARGDYKKYSDLDLAIQSTKTIKQKTWLELQEQFSESPIPFKIDLIEMSKIEPFFKKAIEAELKSF